MRALINGARGAPIRHPAERRGAPGDSARKEARRFLLLSAVQCIKCDAGAQSLHRLIPLLYENVPLRLLNSYELSPCLDYSLEYGASFLRMRR
ncbi:hypothetical protein NDU88_000793 [Pleurodeles waltl]|uniref:Uncharacterized protein n=1 Tax=Pleurodeles waltl TaxID=8319 RepID=A0AAV7LXK5_PLEWA|nr:hypothetical protein NDU88_000793 [Pleurodeles waltl]